MQYERLGAPAGHAAFLLVYFTFFLDNVLLTVLVPIIPDWVRGESLALWAERAAPLAQLLNTTVQRIADETEGEGIGASQLAVGAVLGAKAGAQLVAAPAAAAATERLGPARCLRLATLLLALASLTFAWCGAWCGGRQCAWCAGAGRGAQGAGAALAGVAGLALVSRARRPARVAALLGAVALGVLVGYPFGGVAYKLWSEAAPFQLIAAAFVANLGMQYIFLNKPEYNEVCEADGGGSGGGSYRSSLREVWAERRGAGGAGAGAVFAATALLAALEPCLPLWVMERFHPQRWALGAMFVPDSLGYLVATSALPACGAALGGERAALAGAVAAALGALLLPAARSLTALALCQAAVGGGVGAVDAALVPALLARCGAARLPHRAALLQAAASAALALGPVVGGVLSFALGFETALRLLALAALLHAALLHRALSDHPLSEQWGAPPLEELSAETPEETPLQPANFAHFH
ncbi:synaptic vesicular amine transporter-like [Zerene cesonia]|uniref:synaptic vesicular amine transporter-like n=1 Tax=Zerene cesonia TaxID=33412 RepID=UPI0018E4E268|nr:synaptic vesicular amine transporter-like [Zerene cesonia]